MIEESGCSLPRHRSKALAGILKRLLISVLWLSRKSVSKNALSIPKTVTMTFALDQPVFALIVHFHILVAITTNVLGC